MNLDTILLHAGQTPDPATGSRAAPIYLTSCYAFKDTAAAGKIFALETPGYIYTRLNNPTNAVLEERLAAMEGGTGALATSSGMAAIFLAVQTIAGAGDHIVASASLYGGTDTLFRYTFKKFGIDVTFVEDPAPERVHAAIRANTKLVYTETIANPKGDVPDLDGIAAVAHAAGLPLVVDNTFAPLICRPFDHGADIVVHSCTKWIGGHGTAIGGAIIDGGRFDWASSRAATEFTTPDESYHGLVYADLQKAETGNIAFVFKARVQGMRNIGPCASPFNSFLFLQGLETLSLRMKLHCENAMRLAQWLQNHPAVAWVNYTGLPGHPSHEQASRLFKNGYGSVFGFGLKGGFEAAAHFIDHVKLCSHVANVGDAKTLVIHPASTTHSQLNAEQLKACGITPDFIRVSVGLEDPADIQADFTQAFRP